MYLLIDTDTTYCLLMILVALVGFILWYMIRKYHCFKHFKAMAENLFSSKIKYFQGDGAYEFIKGEIKSFLEPCGILCRTSCPDT